MLVTDEEAETKWCPFTRDAGGANRHGHGSSDEVRCIGSDCMAWRWDNAGNQAAEQEHEDSSAIGGVYIREEPKRRGYCGLAGAPAR